MKRSYTAGPAEADPTSPKAHAGRNVVRFDRLHHRIDTTLASIVTCMDNVAPDNALKLLHIGPVTKNDDLHLLTRVFAALVPVCGNLSLIVQGSGPYLAQMQAQLSHTPRFFIDGSLALDVNVLFDWSDILISPGNSPEALHLAYCAQCRGMPVIIYGNPCTGKVVAHRKTGLVITPGDAECLLDAILYLVAHPEKISRMRHQARRRALCRHMPQGAIGRHAGLCESIQSLC